MERIVQFAEVSGNRFPFNDRFAGTIDPHLHFLHIGELDVGRDLIQCESAGVPQLLEPFRAVAAPRTVVDTVLGPVRAGVPNPPPSACPSLLDTPAPPLLFPPPQPLA